MIRVIEVKASLFGRLSERIERVLSENNITREKLIDIKFSHDGISYALVIFEE